MRQAWALMVAMLTLFVLTACGESPSSDESASTSLGNPARGRDLFETGGASQIPCASCHTLDGTDLVGPSLQGIGERAATRTELSAEEYLRQSITQPSAYVVDGFEDLMNKNYASLLSTQDIEDLIAFMLTQ